MIYVTYEQLLQIYPTLTSADFNLPMLNIVLQDDSNGLGPYIAKWDYSQPIPTQSQVEALG